MLKWTGIDWNKTTPCYSNTTRTLYCTLQSWRRSWQSSLVNWSQLYILSLPSLCSQPPSVINQEVCLSRTNRIINWHVSYKIYMHVFNGVSCTMHACVFCVTMCCVWMYMCVYLCTCMCMLNVLCMCACFFAGCCCVHVCMFLIPNRKSTQSL